MIFAVNKQRYAALLAGIFLFLLAGCGGPSDADQGAVSGETVTGTVSAIAEKEISLETEGEETITIPLSDDTLFQREEPDMDGQAPEGDPPGGELDGAAPPERPEGAGQGGGEAPPQPSGSLPPEGAPGTELTGGGPAPDGEDAPGVMEPQELTYQDISVGDTVTVVVGDDGVAQSVTLAGGGPGMGGPGGQSSAPDTYEAANQYTQDTQVQDAQLTSSGTDENAVLVATESVTADLDGVAITRNSDNSTGGDASSFYGVGAAALVTDGTLVLSNSTVTTDAAGGAGVFAYGDGTAYVEDTVITTHQDTSGGIHVAGGGSLYAWDLTVETDGASAAAIRSDRGSGTMVVDGGSYTSNGEGSPAVYSTADITVHDADLAATGSEAVCIEGLNTLRLFDCDLSGHMSDLEQNDCTWNVILYQSMSGDSEEGNSVFEMVGGSLTAQNGGMFYTTNTESTFLLSDVDITYSENSPFLLKCTGNANARGWGTAGDNGADCSFTGVDQVLEGDVIWDSISCLDFYLTQGSTLTGAVRQDESNAGAGGDGWANVYVDAGSTWVVTGDSIVTDLQCAGTIVDENGRTVSIVGTDGTAYVSGDSPYRITVTSYEESADVSGASTLDSWSDYEVARP